MCRNTVDFSAERAEAVRAAFRKRAREAQVISIPAISRDIARQPAPRFYVSEERASNVVSQLMQGADCLKGMREPKRRMFLEIYRRVKRLREEQPETPISSCVAEVIYDPAPEFYLAPGYVADIIYRRRG